jgi:hypothetical protein
VTLKQPDALAVGPTGDLYVADAQREQILKRRPHGRFQVVAGTGVEGDSGDGGPATKARIWSPLGLAVAPNGVVYLSQQSRVGTLADTVGVVREITRDGRINTIAGAQPNCQTATAAPNDIPAESAQLFGEELTIGLNGRLDLRIAACPEATNQSGYVQLNPSGRLVPTSADAVPNGGEFCGGGVIGNGFVVFSCASGDRRGPRLMVVQTNGRTANYPDRGSQAGYMAEANGSVVANYNLNVVRITANSMKTIATSRQIAHLVPRAIGIMGGGGGDVAVSRNGTIYALDSVLTRPHGCTSVIAQIDPNRSIRAMWRSAPNQTCF